jgi:hypothetical protein
MDNLIALLFVACAGAAVFAGLHKKDIQEGRVPEPIAAYING